jgi:hypothetical protein
VEPFQIAFQAGFQFVFLAALKVLLLLVVVTLVVVLLQVSLLVEFQRLEKRRLV